MKRLVLLAVVALATLPAAAAQQSELGGKVRSGQEVTVLVAVVLGLLGLGSLTGMTVFGGILVAAIVVFLFLLAVAFAAQAIVGLALGRLLVRGAGRSFLGGLGALASGVAVVVLLSAIPVAGGLLEALVVLLGLGAVLLLARPARRRLPEPVG
jgi:hypothetical protein